MNNGHRLPPTTLLTFQFHIPMCSKIPSFFNQLFFFSVLACESWNTRLRSEFWSTSWHGLSSIRFAMGQTSASYINCLGSSPGSAPDSSFWLVHPPGRQQGWPRVRSLHPHRRRRIQSLAWSFSVDVGMWGVSWQRAGPSIHLKEKTNERDEAEKPWLCLQTAHLHQVGGVRTNTGLWPRESSRRILPHDSEVENGTDPRPTGKIHLILA